MPGVRGSGRLVFVAVMRTAFQNEIDGVYYDAH